MGERLSVVNFQRSKASYMAVVFSVPLVQISCWSRLRRVARRCMLHKANGIGRDSQQVLRPAFSRPNEMKRYPFPDLAGP